MTRTRSEVEELAAHGARELAHPGGTLLAHLGRTYDTLASWGARPALRLAGLAHAAYGTDGFPHGLVDVADRARLAAVIGEEAEDIVYLYGSCDRAAVYRQLNAGTMAITFPDRFTGAARVPAAQQVRDFVELTYANELDVLAHNEELRARHGDGLRRLFTASRGYVTDQAFAAFTGRLAAPEHDDRRDDSC
jgi:hypothetical protein